MIRWKKCVITYPHRTPEASPMSPTRYNLILTFSLGFIFFVRTLMLGRFIYRHFVWEHHIKSCKTSFSIAKTRIASDWFSVLVNFSPNAFSLFAHFRIQFGSLQYVYSTYIFNVKFNSWIFTRYLRNNVLSTLASHGDEHAVDYSLTGFRMWMKNQRLTIQTIIINELKIHHLLLSHFHLLKWRFRHCWSQQYAGRVSQRNQVMTQLTRESFVTQ